MKNINSFNQHKQNLNNFYIEKININNDYLYTTIKKFNEYKKVNVIKPNVNNKYNYMAKSFIVEKQAQLNILL
tara:strand:- start:484 stop:702 length:219 start_codon:yes stop_codon:yes gene_type:complete